MWVLGKIIAQSAYVKPELCMITMQIRMKVLFCIDDFLSGNLFHKSSGTAPKVGLAVSLQPDLCQPKQEDKNCWNRNRTSMWNKSQ